MAEFGGGRRGVTMMSALMGWGLDMLGQSAPIADTDTTLYTCPAGAKAIIPLIVICNTSAGIVNFRLHHSRTGAAAAVGNALIYGKALAANDTFTFPPDIPAFSAINLVATGKIIVRSVATAAITWTAYGYEIRD